MKIQMKKYKKPVIILIFLLCILTILFPFEHGHKNDLGSFYEWIWYMRDVGLTNIYQFKDVNYFPFFLYILALFGLFFPNSINLIENIYRIKSLLVVFDYATIGVVVWLLKKVKIKPWYSLMILLNPAYLYNSLFWGQIESIYIFFVISAFIAGINKKPLLAIVCYVFAFYTKMQAIVFLPGIVLLLLPGMYRTPKKIIWAGITLVATNIIVVLPFIANLSSMYSNVLKSVDFFPFLTVNATNIWNIIFLNNSRNISDTLYFGIFTYRTWGILLFCIASIMILIPIFLNTLKIRKKKLNLTKKYIGDFFLANAMVSFAFYALCTQMHERYLQPTIILLGLAYIFKRGKSLLALYILTSIGFVLNLEKVLTYLDTQQVFMQFIPSPLIACFMMALFVWGIVEIYKGKITKHP